MNGIERIAAERRRQTEVEGWSQEHDAEHTHGELVRAASCYALNVWSNHRWRINWPWDFSWWKPSGNVIRDLEKAGALIAAEIDRRLAAGEEAPEPTRPPGWFFTFGYGQPFYGRYHFIPIADQEKAMEEMCRRFGEKWAVQYPTAEAAGVDTWGLIELK